MKCNVGGIDRIIRGIVGLVIVAAGVYFKSWWGAIGLALLFTVVFRYCPIYVPFKISSCKKV